MPSHEAIPENIAGHRQAWLFKPVWNRLHRKNKMWSCCFCGEPGAGKSWGALSIASMLDPTFNLSRVAFTVSEFAALMNQKLPRGAFCLLDDCGLFLYSRESMQKSVRQISKTFMSMRYKNLGVILSLPALGMLDKNIRMLLNAFCEPLEIDFEKQKTRCKFHFLQYDARSGKCYAHRPKKIVWDYLQGSPVRHVKRLDSIWIDRPSEELTTQYEKRKEEFLTEWNKKNAAEIDAIENPKKSKGVENIFNVLYKMVSKNQSAYASEGKIDAGKIALAHSCSLYYAKQVAICLNKELKAKRKQRKKCVAKAVNTVNLTL